MLYVAPHQVDKILVSINKTIIHANIKLLVCQVFPDFYFLGTWMVRLDILAHDGWVETIDYD